MPSLWHFATSEGTPLDALIMGLVVGTILSVINHGDVILAGEKPDFLKIGLTYLVPYCVATYGSVTAKRRAWLRQNGSGDSPRPSSSGST